MMKILSRTALAMVLGLSFASPFVRADEPKKTEASTKPAAPKDEPSVPSVKGNPDDPKNGFLKRHEGFLKDKE